MVEPVLTDEQQRIVESLQREIHTFADRTPEQLAEGWIRMARRQCAEMNAATREERLQFLAELHGGDYDAVEASVQDVTWEVRVEDGLPTLIANLLFARTIEQVYVTVEVGPKGAT